MAVGRDDIPALTGLRGIAALTVVTFHARVFTAASIADFPPALARGYLAVDFFFVLSGFVMTHVYGTAFADRVAAADYGSFLRARFARVYPLHALVLIAMLPLYGSGRDFHGTGLAYSFALLNGPWLAYQCWNRPSWSISAEAHAYLIFPFIVGPLTRWPLVRALAMVAGPLLVVAGAGAWQNTEVYGPLMLLRAIPEFALGIIAYRLWRSKPFKPGRRHGDLAACVLVLAIALLALVPRTDFVIVAFAFPALLICCANAETTTRWVLGSGPVAYLGRISYSLYIIHWPLIVGLFFWRGAPLAGWSTAIGIIAACVAIAAPVSHFIEFPLRSLMRGSPNRR
jgi:peptidoglycan/LPS O-acetylase OafA/YrhL